MGSECMRDKTTVECDEQLGHHKEVITNESFEINLRSTASEEGIGFWHFRLSILHQWTVHYCLVVTCWERADLLLVMFI